VIPAVIALARLALLHLVPGFLTRAILCLLRLIGLPALAQPRQALRDPLVVEAARRRSQPIGQALARGTLRRGRILQHRAQSLSQAAGEARRQAWRYFGGFWVWLASVGATGALMGALAVFWLQGRADASAFGKHPGIYCERAGGTVVTNTEGRKFCGVWIDPLPQQAGE
jgi:hypothetical protein